NCFLGSNNYTFESTSLSWEDAQRYCREKHTDLVTIWNQAVNEQLFLETGQKSSWIGLRHENDRWQWSNVSANTGANWGGLVIKSR
uniref:C-type lectin domain-containing protein n=1 Tax=Erpetoichthys calabaricus TaxID=27687 RepID=A0A8C4RTV7_ERPCA